MVVKARAAAELLEREAALAMLERAFADARGGEGRLVLVSGEAGVGKTVLVRRFCELHADAARVLWGDCVALFTLSPLGPIADGASTLASAAGKPADPFACADNVVDRFDFAAEAVPATPANATASSSAVAHEPTRVNRFVEFLILSPPSTGARLSRPLQSRSYHLCARK